MSIKRHHLAKESVLSDQIKDGEVKTADIGALQVTAAKIADASVTKAKVDTTTVKYPETDESGKAIKLLRVAGPASYAAGGFTVASGLTSIDAYSVAVEGGGEYIAQVVSFTGGDLTVKVRDNIEQFVDESSTSTYTIGGEVANTTNLSAVYFVLIVVGNA